MCREKGRVRDRPAAARTRAFTTRSITLSRAFRNWSCSKTDEQRNVALAEIATDTGNLKSGGFWLGVLLYAGSMLATLFASQYMLRYLPFPYWIEQWLPYVPVIAVGWFTLRYLHRSGLTTAVRQKLLDRNIPICIKCGYSLRGQTLHEARCPECGLHFDARVREILTNADSSAGNPFNS